MAESPDNELMFVTVSMAEILLAQNLVSDTAKVVARLRKIDPNNPRVIALAKRLEEMARAGSASAAAIDARGEDYVELEQRTALCCSAGS